MSAGPAQREGDARGAARPAAQRRPDFFLAGHHKSGTTAMHAMLSQHPQVFMPELKEPHFLATDRRSRFGEPRGLPATREEYLALFAPARPDQIAGEASASYLWSRTAAAEIAALCPEARIVGILREPASHLRSLHQGYQRLHWEDQPDLLAAVDAGEARRAGREIPKRCPYPQMLVYADQVNYVEQLRRYHAHFPRERVLVLIYDDFRADNAATMRDVAAFLGIDDSFPFQPVDANRTTRVMRRQRLDDTILSAAVGQGRAARAARSTLRALTPDRLRKSAVVGVRRKFVFAEPPAEDPETMLELRRRFKGEVEAASDYLGRDLVRLWGYDRLD